MSRRLSALFLLIAASWVVMTMTHEIGHLIGGWCGGASLTDYDLAPWRMPYSIHHPDPHPRVTLWAGPILGVIIPLTFAMVIRHRWVWFVADFCIIANGAYLALAWIAGDRMLDTPRLLQAGASPVSIALYCLVTIGFGYVRLRSDCIALLSPLNSNTPPSPT